MTMYSVNGTDLTNIANAIRAKTGEAGTMTIADMSTEIESISGGNVQTKTLIPNFNNGDVTITPETGQIGFSSVTIQKDSNLIASNIKKDVTIHGITGNYESSIEYLFLSTDLIANYYIEHNGTQIAYNNWSCTDFIEVTPGETLKVACADNRDYNCWYDTSKQFLTYFRLAATGYSELTVPANTYYVRFSNVTDNIQNYIRLWR